MRGSREISLVPSLHRASTDALIPHCLLVYNMCINCRTSHVEFIVGFKNIFNYNTMQEQIVKVTEKCLYPLFFGSSSL